MEKNKNVPNRNHKKLIQTFWCYPAEYFFFHSLCWCICMIIAIDLSCILWPQKLVATVYSEIFWRSLPVLDNWLSVARNYEWVPSLFRKNPPLCFRLMWVRRDFLKQHHPVATKRISSEYITDISRKAIPEVKKCSRMVDQKCDCAVSKIGGKYINMCMVSSGNSIMKDVGC